jgi:hypothetical protein
MTDVDLPASDARKNQRMHDTLRFYPSLQRMNDIAQYWLGRSWPISLQRPFEACVTFATYRKWISVLWRAADQTRRRNAAAILQIFDKGRRPSLQGRDTGVLIAVMQNGE